MKPCERCGSLNCEAACAVCGNPMVAPVVADAACATPSMPASPLAVRPRVLILFFAAIAGGILLIAYTRANQRYHAERDRLAAEVTAAEQEHDEAVEYERSGRRDLLRTDEARHRIRLANKDLISGQTARIAHNEEWKRRLAHDPVLVSSPVEANLLKMLRVGSDPAVAAQEALRQVAQMASPPGSRVDVSPVGLGFNVRVAFKLSSVALREEGDTTKHHTVAAMRREIESLSARLVKQLFDYCGSRGIEKLSVSCNRAVRGSPIPEGATPQERQALLNSGELVMRSLYRISLPASSISLVPDWRQVSESTVLRLVSVEKDGLPNLSISGQSGSVTQDPDMPLEF